MAGGVLSSATAAAMNVLLRELQSGGAALAGTAAAGAIRIAEADLNDAIAPVAAASRFKLELHGDNRVLVRFGVFHATVVLPPPSDLSQSSALTFSLGSIAIAWALKAVVKQPYVRIHGRHVIVDLAA